jgi:colanic acid biosynthesis protein WcaH
MQIPDEVYQTVLRSMPIPCVDLIVFNSAHELLLVRRTNEPARGQWWFPGGRVHFGENREAAVTRQLLKECGLHAATRQELWTLDVILPIESTSRVSHGITTLYAVTAKAPAEVTLDDQASEFAWRRLAAWQKESLHPMVHQILLDFESRAWSRLESQLSPHE